ncbi:hypothetical protein GINT2_001319 [Glugoides intestinalis]
MDIEQRANTEIAENNADTSSEKLCKICHAPCNDEAEYVYPCKCNGSLKYIHIECLNEWLRLTNIKKCDLCNYEFKFQKTFKKGTPNRVPLRYIVLFILKSAHNLAINLGYFVATLLKVFTVIFVNTFICITCFYNSDSVHITLLFSLLFFFINLLHSLFLMKIIKVANSYRTRMRSTVILQNLRNDITSRSAEETAEPLSMNHENSTNSADSEQQVLDPFDQNINLRIQDIFCRRLTPENLKQDLLIMGQCCFFAILYFTIYHFSVFLHFIIKQVEKHLEPVKSFYKLAPRFFDFVVDTKLKPFFLGMLGIIIFFTGFLSFLYYLKLRSRSELTRNAFYIAKCYVISIMTSFFICCCLGIIAHFAMCLSFNNGTFIFEFGHPIPSVIVHVLIGSIFINLAKDIKQKLIKMFRPGLIMNTISNESFSKLFDYCCSVSMWKLLYKTVYNCILISLLPITIFYISTFGANLKLVRSDTKWTIFHFKIFMLLYGNGDNITSFITLLFEKIIYCLSKVFDADNYLYNVKTASIDKKRLCWAANSGYITPRYEQFLFKINSLIKDCEIKEKDDILMDDERILSDSFVSEESFRRRNISYIRNSHIIDNPESKFTKRTLASSTLLNSMAEQVKDKIIQKYAINDRRIEKYYGRKHQRKFSIYCIPKLFPVFKLLSFILCFLAFFLLFNLVFRLSIFFMNLTRFNIETAKTEIFIYLSCLTLVTISYSHLFFTRNIRQTAKIVLNTLLVSLYTNFVFPSIAAFAYVAANANRNVFSSFSTTFFILNSFSPLLSSIFRIIFLFSQVGTYSAFYILRKLASFLALKLWMFFCFVVYMKLVTFPSFYIPIFVTAVLGVKTVKFFKLIISGTLLEKIKEHFFLDNTTVINYQHSVSE